jgi:hypothetical protein
MMHFLRLSEVPVVFQPDAPELAGAGGATCAAFAVSGFIDLVGHFDEGIGLAFKPSWQKPTFRLSTRFAVGARLYKPQQRPNSQRQTIVSAFAESATDGSVHPNAHLETEGGGMPKRLRFSE